MRGGGEKAGELPRIRGDLVLIPLGGSGGTLVSHPSPDCDLVMDKARQEDAQPPRAWACKRPQTELAAPPLSFPSLLHRAGAVSGMRNTNGIPQLPRKSQQLELRHRQCRNSTHHVGSCLAVMPLGELGLVAVPGPEVCGQSTLDWVRRHLC